MPYSVPCGDPVDSGDTTAAEASYDLLLLLLCCFSHCLAAT